MQIEAINARVVSQSGHTIARERRESEFIPQVLPVARGPAVIPAAIQPAISAAIVSVQRRPALNRLKMTRSSLQSYAFFRLFESRS